jgi:hypothetical protein
MALARERVIRDLCGETLLVCGDGDLGLGLGVCLLTRRVDERDFALVLPVAAGAVYVTVRLLSVGITHIHCVDTMSMGSIFHPPRHHLPTAS